MSAHIDELSIDLATNKKIPARRLTNGDDQVDSNKMIKATTLRSNGTTQSDMTMTSSQQQQQKAHFRIDWRQLTYYAKEPRSELSDLFSRRQKLKQQQKSVYELIDEEGDELNEENDDNESEGGQSLSYCGLSGTSCDLKVPFKRRAILNSLDGCFRSGELAAILGPSGAGKSTFLSALFGNKQESSYGQTKVTWFPPTNQQDHDNHQPTLVNPNEQQRALRIASLPQHDHLLNHLSVYETLMFASKIKNPKKAGDKLFHRQNVKRVAKMLKLTDCFNTRCGRLSGGQYKRVSIGQELLSEPDVIILDEPTSGLDAMTCLTTIRTLKSIVLKHPISIILTIHQPDIDVFNLFDHVYVIAQGGMAIYEGPPQDVATTLAQANLFMPSESYNPARFIVENAFVADLEAATTITTTTAAGIANNSSCNSSPMGGATGGGAGATAASPNGELGEKRNSFQLTCAAGISEEETSSDDEVDVEMGQKEAEGGFLRRSITSLQDALKGKSVDLKPDANGVNIGGRFRDSGRRPLLNIGIQTADGKLITSDQLVSSRQAKAAQAESQLRKQQIERLQLLKRLNRMQKEKYYDGTTLTSGSCLLSDILSQKTLSSVNEHHHHQTASLQLTDDGRPTSVSSSSSSSCDANSATDTTSWSEARETIETSSITSSSSIAGFENRRQHFIVNLSAANNKSQGNDSGAHSTDLSSSSCSSSASAATTLKQERGSAGENHHHHTGSHTGLTDESIQLNHLATGSGRLLGGMRRRAGGSGGGGKLRRQFDKRLSAKHIQSKQSEYPIWYHSSLLMHRTWLSIVRDPIFFGIQFTMHTTIPILLALIFGSAQEEGCPQVGNFDLVQFAYSDQANFIQSTMRSIRQSIGNIGIIFFEMFVLSFAINCITALVFPLDMYVLLKEYRNGWYSLRSYFFGRTLADLPVPIVLHSMAMCILCYLTGQPLSWWRFSAIIGIVILASLVAQSVGLTIGALLMRSSQSAVLAAAGIVAPFFALSGFIVRIHTLPWVAKWAAQGSYLYHLLNGFIIMRYGYDRCQCNDEDFLVDESHQIPGNLKTMASMWIGTYSNEFTESSAQMRQLLASQHTNRTNLDPNIDIIDKLMAAFKMANSFGHKVETCQDVLPYAMLDFNLKDADIWHCCLSLAAMLLISRMVTFGAIYYKIRSFS